MDRFIIHYCDSEKVVNIEFDNYLPGGTGYTIGWEGGVLEIPYMGCVSSLTGDFVSYNIGSTAITVTIAPNATISSINHNLTIHWCNGDDTAIVIVQEASSYAGMYLTFKSISDSQYYSNTNSYSLQYSLDNGATWNSLVYTGTGVHPKTPVVPAGSTILWKGDNQVNLHVIFQSTGRYEAYGNVMSLKYGDNFAGETTLSDYRAFQGLFNASDIVSAENLILPATTLYESCYVSMFSGCRSLTTAPALPATTLASGCYASMFYGCTSLTIAPELPATTLTQSCYYGMFASCTSLVTVPDLIATTLANGCYNGMFARCTSLTTAPAICATTMATSACSYMFEGCTSLTTVPTLSATTLAERCYAYMFSGCTSLVTAPEICATTVATSACSFMFDDCTSLTTAPSVLPATTLVESCYFRMFQYCTSLINAPALPATTLASYCYGYMFWECTSLTTAPVLPATTLVYDCYTSMFAYCSRLNYVKAMWLSYNSRYTNGWLTDVAETGTFVKNSEARWSGTGTDKVPAGWTVQYADY